MELIALGQALANPFVRTDSGIPFITQLTGSGETKQVSLEAFAAKPCITRAAVKIEEVDSFCRYVNTYRADAPLERLAIFADITTTGATFTAILDYHNTHGGEAERGENRAVFACTPTVEWSRWMGLNGVKMSQADFALFLEDNAPDIAEPSSAQMLEIALNLEAKTEGDFASAVRLQNGTVNFKYSENTAARVANSEVEVPAEFTIGISPFVGFAPWKIKVRLRYRLAGGKLTFWYELVRPHKVVEEAAKEVLEKITTNTAMVPFRGSVASMGMK